jgi:ribose transport system permease protein
MTRANQTSPVVSSEAAAALIASQADEQRRNRTTAWLERAILAILVVMVAAASLLVPNFTSGENIRSVLIDSSFLGIVAVGITFVVVSGNFIDLSVVAQIGTAGVMVVQLEKVVGLPLAILAAVLGLQVYALLNTFGVGLMRANAVVVTLAVLTAGLGTLQFFVGGSPYPNGSAALYDFASATVGPVPVPFIVLVVLAIVGQLVLSRTNAGLAVRATGTLRAAARNSGVRPVGAIWIAFACCSLAAAIAGILLAGFNNIAIASMGTGYDFVALAAVIIGGASLFGGRANVVFTLVGVLFVSVLINILVLVGLPYIYQELVKGLIIILAVALDAALRRKGLK